jgi:hypothetical protein
MLKRTRKDGVLEEVHRTEVLFYFMVSMISIMMMPAARGVARAWCGPGDARRRGVVDGKEAIAADWTGGETQLG